MSKDRSDYRSPAGAPRRIEYEGDDGLSPQAWKARQARKELRSRLELRDRADRQARIAGLLALFFGAALTFGGMMSAAMRAVSDQHDRGEGALAPLGGALAAVGLFAVFFGVGGTVEGEPLPTPLRVGYGAAILLGGLGGFAALYLA